MAIKTEKKADTFMDDLNKKLDEIGLVIENDNDDVSNDKNIDPNSIEFNILGGEIKPVTPDEDDDDDDEEEIVYKDEEEAE